jgi:hypothetical protein
MAGEGCIMRSFSKYDEGGKVGHVARIAEKRNTYNCGSKNLKGRDHSEGLGVDEKIILEQILGENGCEVVDWMHLAQERTSGGLL